MTLKTKRTKRHSRKKEASLENKPGELIVEPEQLKQQPVVCTNVSVDDENLKHCSLCFVSTMRFCVALFVIFAIAAVVIASVVLFVVFYDSYNQTVDVAIIFGMSWCLFFTMHVVVSTIYLGNYGSFAGKEHMFMKWRICVRTLFPILMYMILWLPLILQQFDASRLPTNDYYTFCWVDLGIFWLLAFICVPCTALAMFLFKPTVTEKKKEEETLIMFKNWLYFNLCCMTFAPCHDCGCKE